jgi:hypothetical protein
MLKLDFVLKFVVMEKDILQNVMTEITLMVMDAVKIVDSKLVSHAMEDLQALKTLVLPQFQLFFQLKTEDNQGYSEKSL